MVVPTDTNISTCVQDSRPRPLKVSYSQVPIIIISINNVGIQYSNRTNPQKLPHPGLHHLQPDHKTKNQCCQRFMFLQKPGASYVRVWGDRHAIKTVPSQLDGSSLIGLFVLSVGESLSGSLAQPLRATADYSKLLPAIAKYYSRRCADQAWCRRTRWIENPDHCMVCVLSSYILGFYVVLSTSIPWVMPFLLSYVQFDMFSEPHHLLFPQHFIRFPQRCASRHLFTTKQNTTQQKTVTVIIVLLLNVAHPPSIPLKARSMHSKQTNKMEGPIPAYSCIPFPYS